MNRPVLRHIANLWTFMRPKKEMEWSLDQKLQAIRNAGFDGVCWAGSPELQMETRRHGLIFVGGIASGDPREFPRLLQEQKDAGAHHVNVQLACDQTTAAEALDLAMVLMQQGRRLGLAPAIESHRGTCTETPEKAYGLADAYQERTGQLLPMAWDFSHFAVVKHLVPANFTERLLIRPDLIQYAQQFHFRPFNGHHAQVPITDGRGALTPEVEAWLPFAEALLRCWLDGNHHSDREILICPELGPVEGGYALSTFPDSWEETKTLRVEIDKLWKKLAAEY